ncbi:glycosyltransferase [Rhodococcus sp. IEGM 1409]|uniref:glycosyltransferase n=1 Tax=Rhodococcus sp. IEGM 1409 TaxID=3047082 RepID=UPI0024B65623|nr:glycosyltransferase [Rhodococcus sp. IEGM 1409]MDI9898534.1 glycosyltransferase [Rhodococcus sp. IEGM 1409]
MKILHVVTLLSPDAAYGGPIRVALNQATALQDHGHDVTIAAGTRGYAQPPTQEQGIALQLFPARTLIPKIGYAGIAAPGMLLWLRKHLREFDVVHIHLARDFVTLPVARLALAYGVPFVAQTHGMIDGTDKLLAKPLDAALTVPVLRGARTVFHLTDRERQDLLAVTAGHDIHLVELNNGIPESEEAVRPVIGDDQVPDVLFLARLQERKRPQVFVDAACVVLDSGRKAHFSIVGPDEGEAAAVTTSIEQSSHRDSIRYEGPLPFDQSTARYSRSSIYVLPSVNEPFPMSVLEAMAAGLPVIVTDTCGVASLIRDGNCGIVVDDTTEALSSAISWMLNNPEESANMGTRARDVARNTLGMDAVRKVLEAEYSKQREGRLAVS